MMLKMFRFKPVFSAGLALIAAVAPLPAAEVVVTIENLQPSDGFFFTPVWLGFQDGSFDLFDMGAPASDGLEEIAETGNTVPLGALFTSAMNGDGTARFETTIIALEGFAGAPVFDPGESVTKVISVSDAASNRYLTYASMVIPSNDAFFGNGNPMAYPIFNEDGSFAGPVTIEIFGSQIYDAGTEVNDGMGAAFSATGGIATDEGSVVEAHAGLDNFLGTDTVAETTIASALGGDTLLGRITISAVPEPSAFAMSLLGIAGVLRQVRRRGRR